MKLTWKKKRPQAAISRFLNLPFEHQTQEEDDKDRSQVRGTSDTQLNKEEAETLSSSDTIKLSESFRTQGDKLAEEGRFREALGKWEAALTLMPENAVLHEQKAQVLLEIGDTWSALKAATRATDLEPSWAEAWITLGRAQLNFGEPDTAIESFDTALALKPDSEEAQDDRRTASHLVKRRKQLQSTGLSTDKNRFLVGDKMEAP